VGKTPRIDILELKPFFTRWTLDLETGNVSEQQLDDVWSEFPRMHEGFLGRKSRFSYNQRLALKSQLLFEGLIKYDTQSGSSTSFDYGESRYASEPVFAPRPDAKAEDDGYILHMIYNSSESESEFWIHDARDISCGPIARISLPARVNAGFHSCWVPV